MNALQQLTGLILPKPVSWWPLAPGWYVVMILAVIVLMICIYKQRKHYMNNRYRREALLKLQPLSMTNATQMLSVLQHALNHAAMQQVELQKKIFLVQLNQGINTVSFTDVDWSLLTQLSFQQTDKIRCNEHEFSILKIKCQQWVKEHHYDHYT